MGDIFHAPADARGYDFASLEVRELTGRDDVSIAKRCKGIEDGLLRVMERVRASIVKVDGKVVQQPFEEFDTWRERSRNLALNAYQKVNGVEGKVVEDFLSGSGSKGSSSPSSI